MRHSESCLYPCFALYGGCGFIRGLTSIYRTNCCAGQSSATVCGGRITPLDESRRIRCEPHKELKEKAILLLKLGSQLYGASLEPL